MDHKGRLKRLQEELHKHKLDALLVTHLPNIHYLCGFSGSAGGLLLSEKDCIFFTDGRYTTQARAEVQIARVAITRQSGLTAAADWLKSRGKGLRRIGIEAEHMTVGTRSRLAEVLPSRMRLRDAPALVEQARMIKDDEEIARLRAAVMLGASLFDTVLKTIRPGVKETDVAAEMEYAARRAGAEQMSFETIIAAGERSALPHGRASQARIPAQGFVVCDFGVILAGYCSDMTRTVHVGDPTPEARQTYEAVRQAQQAAAGAVRSGTSVGEVDRAARKLLHRKHLAKFFTHSTGHGVGLEIHEPPRIAAAQTEVLRPGMVITIEPGVYLSGKWGVRIEDMVVVRERGCETLTPTSKELIVI